ncbi:MAG: hypothetical protein KGI42_09545 [Xanthomonadaceae bacterium]|nr:hypothetical protein [Xanthomonadaceae bacterium]
MKMANLNTRVVRLTAMLICLMASGSLFSYPSQDKSAHGDWAWAIKNANEDFRVFPKIKYSGKNIDSEKFYEAEAGCTAGAVAILSINDFLVAAPSSIQIEYDVRPDSNVLVYLRRGFSDGKSFDFMCLITKSFELKRVRIVGGFDSSPDPAELDDAHFIYGGKSR